MKSHLSAWCRSSLLAVTCSWLALADVHAQTEGTPASSGSMVLEEVIVTAQRRETSLQRTALSATVLSGDDLIDKGVTGLTAVQYAAPSVNISDYGSANVFNIRGVGRSKVDIEIPSGVVIYQDGVPTIAGYFQNEPYFDIAAVEVLRGPQGTFVGKSASGGAIFIRSRDPELGDFGGQVEVGGGDFSLVEGRVTLNVPVGETVAFRVAGNILDRDHYYDEISGPYTGHPGERDLKSLRLGMLWQPSEQLSVVAKASLSDLDFGGNVTSSFGDPLFDVVQDAPFRYTDESERFVLDIDYAFDNGIRFSSLSGYQSLDTVNNLDVNATSEPTYWFQSAGTIDLWSQEFNLVSPDDQKFRWVFGAFLQNQKSELPSVAESGFTFTGGPFFPNLDYPWLGSPWVKDEDDWAVFAHFAFDIAPSLELEVGARYSDYEFYQITDYVFGDGSVPPTIPFDGVEGPDRQELAEDSVDWKLGLNWTANEANFLYGVISRGHTTGSVNIFPPWDPYDEMEVMNYELGWKAEWQDGRFATQISAYYENIEGYQAAFIDIDIPNSAGQVQNAESDSKIYGVELTGQATLGGLSLDFGVSFNESELGEFNNINHPITGEILDLTGAKFPFSPDFTANIGMEYRFLFANNASLAPRFDFAHIGEARAELFDDPEFKLESRDLLNVQLRYEQGSWYAVAWMTNATDERFVAAIQNQGSLYYAAPPRQYGVRIGVNF